jgi:predicted RNase H-like nuclease (RuvC/YqgF family)
MTFIIKRLKVPALLLFLLLVIGLTSAGNLCAQLKKDQVDFEVLTTVTAEKGYNCCLWNMAEKHLGDYRQWKCIAELNKIPNERRISVGTVVYIPAKCRKGYVEKPAEKPAPAVNELQVKLDDCMAKLKACEDEKEKLAKALDECKKSAKMGDMDALKKCEAERNELAMALENCRKKGEPNKKMRGLKQELEECDEKMQRLTRAMKDKDATIDELEAKMRRMRAEAGDQEAAMGRLREKERRISELERQLEECRKERSVVKETPKPPKPVKGECKSSRSFVAAMAIALVGSIVWIGTSASD